MPSKEPWVTWEGRRAHLTDHARKQLEAEGYDVGMDGLGNYLDPGLLADAAMDSAMYHEELTSAGVKQGYTPAQVLSETADARSRAWGGIGGPACQGASLTAIPSGDRSPPRRRRSPAQRSRCHDAPRFHHGGRSAPESAPRGL